MYMRTPFLVILFASVLFACNNAKAPEAEASLMTLKSVEPDDRLMAAPAAIEANAAPENPSTNATGEPIPTQAQTAPSTVQKKIIKDGTMRIKTADMPASKKRFDVLLKSLNAYYELEDLQNNDAEIRYELKIRIPAENFEKLITSIEGGGDEITGKNIQARDVTEEFLDIATRLENKRVYMKRYQELLSKAQKIEDILAIDENIRTLQEEIESSEGRLKYLNDQVAFSTLNVTLFKNKDFIYRPKEQDKFTERVKSAFSNGWSMLVNLIIGLFGIWPWLILLYIAYRIIKKLIRNKPMAK
jgi:hypothetical protein